MADDDPKSEWERIRDRDRQRPYGRDDSRIGRTSEDRLNEIFFRLGYDIRENDDVQRLAKDLRWAADKRKYDSEQKPHQTAMYVSGFIALVSVALTVFGQWIIAKIKG